MTGVRHSSSPPAFAAKAGWSGVRHLAVFGLACLPFLAAARFGFVAWDDDVGLENNLQWRGVGLEQLRWMFTTFTLGHWQPLAWLSFGVEYALWGVDPGRMHALNIALHGLNAALLFAVARRLLQREGTFAALLAALCFAVHPLRVESAAWITERAHLLATALALGSVFAWLESSRSKLPGRWKLASLALFSLSLLCKAWGIALPLALVILDSLPGAARPERERALAFVARHAREKAAFLALAICAVAIELAAKRGQVDVAGIEEHGFLARVGQAGASVRFLLEKTIWPTELSPLYEFRPGLAWTGLLAAALALVATAALWRARGRFPGTLCAWLGCLALLAPVSGLAQAGLQQHADRYTYLAAMPLSLWAGTAAARVIALAPRTWLRLAAALGAVSILALLGFASARQVQVWRNSETLWRRVVAVDPESFIGWHNLGTTLHRAGRIEESAQAERESVRIEPGARNRDSWFHLGQLEWLYGDRERARQAWAEALKLDPADLRYLDWYASTQPADANRREIWRFALEASPGNAAVEERLARLR